MHHVNLWCTTSQKGHPHCPILFDAENYHFPAIKWGLHNLIPNYFGNKEGVSTSCLSQLFTSGRPFVGFHPRYVMCVLHSSMALSLFGMQLTCWLDSLTGWLVG